MKRTVAMWAVVSLVISVRGACAAGLGIPLDAFLTTFQTWVVGYVGALFDNPFAHILSGSLGFFTKAGLLGGGTVLMGLLGLVGGATL
jgi:hypothetical protein